jgi:hypothetical protein
MAGWLVWTLAATLVVYVALLLGGIFIGLRAKAREERKG